MRDFGSRFLWFSFSLEDLETSLGVGEEAIKLVERLSVSAVHGTARIVRAYLAMH